MSRFDTIFSDRGLCARGRTVIYEYNRYGCPIDIFFGEKFEPKIYLYDGDTVVREINSAFVVFQNQGRFSFEYLKSMGAADCIYPSQMWTEMLTVNPDPCTSWNLLNYRNCTTTPVTEDTLMAATNLDELSEIFGDLGAGSILWSDNVIYEFTVVVDPAESYCNLTASFGVNVFGKPMPLATGLAVVFGIVGVILLALAVTFVCYNKDKLKLN
eukprot:Clim_evm7s49 gene=Clim_evmTU7s49